MRLRVDGDLRVFVPLADFRAEAGLPAAFGVATFQPKDEAGLGAIDGAGAALGTVREAVVGAVPGAAEAAAWLTLVPQLAAVFEGVLNRVNADIGLHEAEVAFAVAGFGDVCSAYGLALFRAQATGHPPPDFDTVYRDWLLGTVRTATAVPYTHHGEIWQVRVVYHAYGRVGLAVTIGGQTRYVADKALACPAEGFMLTLLRAVAAAMTTATR